MEYQTKLPGVVSLCSQAWSMYKAKVQPLLSLALIFFVLQVLFQIIVGPSTKTAPPDLNTAMVAGLAGIILGIVGMATSIAVILVLGENLTAGEALKKSVKLIWPYFYTSIFVSVIVTLGFVLLIVPGIIFAAWYSMVAFVLVLENFRGVSAMKQSKEYVKGHTAEVLFRYLGLMLIAILISIVPSIFLRQNSNLAANLVNSVVFLFLFPFIESYLYQIYMHLKAMKGQEMPPVPPIPQTNG